MTTIDALLGRVMAVEALVQQALSTVGKLLGIASIQTGPGQLVNGSTAIILGPNKLNAFSHITATLRDPVAGGGSLAGVVGLAVPTSGRNFVTGAFLVQAVDATGFAVGTAQASFDWVVVTTG